MRMDWRFAVVMAVLVTGVIALSMPAAANGDDWRKGWPGGKWDKDWDKWDKWDKGRGRGFPVIPPGGPYPAAYPVPYPVYVPANFGGNQGACFQACVNSGQYHPAQCGQMCYYA